MCFFPQSGVFCAFFEKTGMRDALPLSEFQVYYLHSLFAEYWVKLWPDSPTFARLPNLNCTVEPCILH